MEEDDIRFIANSWLKSYREEGFAGGIPNDTYFKKHRRLIQRVLDNRDVLIVSDESPGGNGKIVGWAAFDDEALHYIYVKRGVRGNGFGGAILSKITADKEGVYSHRTMVGKRLCRRLRRSGWKYDPYAFLSPEVHA